MPWFSKKELTSDEKKLAEQCRQEAEALYRSGSHHCAEAVLETVRKHFTPELPESLVQTVSGFGGGSGTGCLCGAVAGGTVGLGLALKDDKKSITHLTRELHIWFKEKYGVTCCKTIRKTHKGACPFLTGEVAGKVAELLEKR